MKWGDRIMTINDGKIGPVSQKLYDSLTALQWGNSAHPFGWVVEVG